jgi:hypothetical protein
VPKPRPPASPAASRAAWLTPCPPCRPQLQNQITQTQQQAAACAAGGAIEPYNPTWAPWPLHAWPDAGKHTCVKMQTHATLIQTENAQAVTQLQQAMNSVGCS